MTKGEPDYLLEDKPITNQKFVLLSILTNDFLKPNDDDTEEIKELKEKKRLTLTTKGIKVRGCFESYEEAVERAEKLKVIDSYHNIYIGEMGKWLPFEDDPEKAKDATYANNQLNKLMKEYNKEQEKGNQAFEARKNELVREALKKNEETVAQRVDDAKLDTEIDEFVSKLGKTEIEENIEKTKELLESNKATLDNIKSKLDEDINLVKNKESHLSKLTDELENAKKLYAKLQDI